MHNVYAFLEDHRGPAKPEWNPIVEGTTDSQMKIRKVPYEFYDQYPVYIVDNVLTKRTCDSLIRQFDQQNQHPVGVDGFCDPKNNVGSMRANAWATKLCSVMTNKMRQFIGEQQFTFLRGSRDIQSKGKRFSVPFDTDFHTNIGYEFIGSTPWMRFMKYKDGGMHTPHHDAPFENQDENYITLFSWVLYLNTPEGDGGHFQFIDDLKQKGRAPRFWDMNDWTNMSNEITLEVEPKRGRLLVFPHWLCHQVQEYTGEGYRYIIRGDVAYGF